MNDQLIHLFNLMINASVDKIGNIVNSEIKYTNGISLCWYNKTDSEKTIDYKPMNMSNLVPKFKTVNWSIFSEKDFDKKLIFEICTPFRCYILPEITDRHAYVDVLDKLDKLISNYEQYKLIEYERDFMDSNM